MTAGAEAPCRARHYGLGTERAILLWEMSDMVRVLADRETSQAITCPMRFIAASKYKKAGDQKDAFQPPRNRTWHLRCIVDGTDIVSFRVSRTTPGSEDRLGSCVETVRCWSRPMGNRRCIGHQKNVGKYGRRDHLRRLRCLRTWLGSSWGATRLVGDAVRRTGI